MSLSSVLALGLVELDGEAKETWGLAGGCHSELAKEKI
jgi:hypothetical protein